MSIYISIEKPVTILWNDTEKGFGSFCFFNKDGKIHCDSEMMSREYVEKVMAKLVAQSIMRDESPNPIPFKQAFDVFIKKIKKDEKMYEKYQTKIVKVFVETFRFSKTCSLREIADIAAKNFLDSLIKKEGK